jgi:FLVCR family MFS transporter 7
MQEDGDVSSSLNDKDDSFIVYRSRWAVLFCFCLLEFANGLMWVTFSPISDIAETYFGVGTFEVNTLATVFLILFPIGALLEVVLMKSIGMANTLNVGALVTTLGTLTRYIAAQCDASRQLPGKTLYGLTLFGQILGSIVQPLFLNVPAHISAAWFPVKERDLATTLGAMSGLIGNAVGQVLPVMLVSLSGGDSGEVQGMPELMLVEFLVCAGAMVLAYIFVKDAPPSPPSATASSSHRQTNQINQTYQTTTTTTNSYSRIDSRIDNSCVPSHGDGEQVTPLRAALLALLDELRALSRDPDYRTLWVSFSLGTGMFNAVITLVNQLVQKRGYSNDDAGTCGVVLILVGLVGAGLVSVLLEKTRKYREIVQYGFSGCSVAMVLLCCMLRPDNLGGLVFSFALLGLVLLPMLPAAYETSVELTYPLSADLSVGLLLVGGNVLGIPLTYALQVLISAPDWGPSPLNAASLFMVLVVSFASALLFALQGRYRRLEAERSVASHYTGSGSGSGSGRLAEPLLN